jgi:hypothetical protein
MVKRPDLVKRNKQNALPKMKIYCKNCDKEMIVKTNNKLKYCSSTCYHMNTNHNRAKGKTWKLSEETKLKHSLVQLGDKNHNWKGGCVKRPKNRFLRNQILKRDNFACAVCGTPGLNNYRNKPKKGLAVHHIASYDNNIDKRDDIENMVTLCNKCHKNFHIKYGYGNNTSKQFFKWLCSSMELDILSIKKTLKESAKIYNISIEGDTTFYANGVLTHNTAPHVIEAKPGNTLHWKSGGKDVFAKKVNHPGTMANPFIRRTFFSKFTGYVNQAALIAEKEVNLI